VSNSLVSLYLLFVAGDVSSGNASDEVWRETRKEGITREVA
jgi:hypothetical protein